MKKRIYLLLLSVVVIFSSCKDDSGDFVEQLFTDEQISMALRDCLRLSSDSTLNMLCMMDTVLLKDHGYFAYDSASYRLELPAAAKQIMDTLILHGFEEILDSLIFNINQAAELSGKKLKNQFLDTTIKLIVFQSPRLILRGGNNTITNYFKEREQNEMFSELKNSIFLEQVNKLDIIQTWNELQETYFHITGKYTSVDILAPSVQQMMDGFFTMMAIIEEAIRNNPELRGKSDSLFNKVFETQ
jgi:hypothetical protein